MQVAAFGRGDAERRGAGTRGFRKFVSASEKALGSGESILPKQSFSIRALLDAKTGRYAGWQRLSFLAAAVLAIAAIGMAIFNEFQRQHRTVFATNDSGGPVEVAVDGGAPLRVVAPTKLKPVASPLVAFTAAWSARIV